MIGPKIPNDEHERLRVLAQYEVLDTPSETTFDGITRLAAHSLGVPIALISIVHESRQWFKSRYGLDAPETPREWSFCGHVVASKESLIVPNAAKDVRFADNPLVVGAPNVCFYAGMPLRTPEGQVLGTLCAIDHGPRDLSPRELEVLQILASQVVSLLELRRTGRLLREERKALAEREIRLVASEGCLRTLFDAMDEGVVVHEKDGAISMCNVAAEKILGLSRDDITGLTSIDPRWTVIREDGSNFPGDQHPAMVTLRTGEAVRDAVMGVTNGEKQHVSWICVNARPLVLPDETAPYSVLVTFRDLTKEKAAGLLAERLASQQRLVTTGTLAAGLGHEINNPLSYMISNIEFVAEELKTMAGGSPSGRIKDLIESLADARDGAERVRKIVRGLKALAREKADPIATSVAPVVDLAVSMSMHEIKQRASVMLEIGPEIQVWADESRLTQVLVNLLVNAAQAFTGSDPATNQIVVSAATLADVVEISVTDNGPGIAPDVLPRIFDPFFTTKPSGIGTGLGLSISHSIATSLGGSLTCETTLGRGTVFRVQLPSVDPNRQHLENGSHAHSKRRILVVDDDEAVLRSMRRLLAANYDVTTLSDPRQALAKLNAGEKYHVIFCDLMMPHLNGLELHKQVRAKDPRQAARFVFVTGGAPQENLARALSDLPNERIPKPFTIQQLRDAAQRLSEHDDE